MSRFSVGEIATLTTRPSECNPPDLARYQGEDVELLRNLDGIFWEVRTSNGDTFYADEWVLRKKRPPKQPRAEIGEWELCPWQPKQRELQA